ncbi:MAG: protein kinase [Saprospiraceae bacterium]|nr:protein kinase [Pyrinomonadaceae bacterium]
MTDEFTGKVIADKYRVDSLLRKGDLGDMYRGWHLFMDKPVTLKILPPSLAVDDTIRKTFSAEARNAVLISHPNILAVGDFAANADGSVYIVFEGFEGEPLSNFIGHNSQISPERAVDISKQIASALAAASEKNVVHGKLNPEKVLIASDSGGANVVKVFDFSSIENYKDAVSNNGIAYTAPEQFSGFATANERTDIYSLGVILYQMLAGATPFNGETPTDVMLKHTEEPPPPIAPFRKDLPTAIEPVVFKALAKDPDLRYQTAQEFANELDGLSYSLANPSAAPAGNNIWKTAFILLAGISLLAVALIYATSVKQTNPVTQLQPDANGQPVQPINPATGVEEQNLAAMPGMMTETMGNSNMAQPPGTLPGGDNYNPWGNGGMPPPGAPLPGYVPPGGPVYMIDPNTGSPFMPPDGVVLVPVPVNTHTAVKPTPTPKTAPANANTSATPAVTKPAPDLKGTPARVAPSPAAPAKPPANKPEEFEN